jgi:hypothetical protein
VHECKPAADEVLKEEEEEEREASSEGEKKWLSAERGPLLYALPCEASHTTLLCGSCLLHVLVRVQVHGQHARLELSNCWHVARKDAELARGGGYQHLVHLVCERATSEHRERGGGVRRR